MTIDVALLLKRLQAYVGKEADKDPMSTDALMGEHMIEMCSSLISDPRDVSHDLMIQQMIAWSAARGLFKPEVDGEPGSV